MAENKRQSFMMNVLTVLCSQVVIKILGFLYRVVMTNIEGFGDAGNGYYNYGYQIYTLLLAISSVGIPNAIAKLVSEKCATNDFKSAYRIFKTALLLFAVIGGALSIGLFVFAEKIAVVICHQPNVQYTLRVLAPAIFFVSLSSVVRGFFQGMHNMKATSTSQMLEQLLKSTSTILIVMAMAGMAPEYMAAGATMATTLSTALSLLYLAGFYKANKKDIKKRLESAPDIKKTSFWKIAKGILYVSIPISLGSIVSSLNRVLDLTTVVRGLEKALADNFNTVEALQYEANRLNGMLSKGDVIINLPLALNIAFSTVLVPTVAGALAKGDKKTAGEKVSISLLMSVVIALPATVGCMLLANQIFGILYPNASDGATLFAMSAVTIFFSAITQTNSGSLQGMGKVFVPAIGLLCGGAVKLIINLTLIPNPAINIYGAPIGSIFCQVIACAVTFVVMKKNLDFKLPLVKYLLKPAAATAVMGVVVWLISRGLENILGMTVATLLSIVVGIIVYAVMLFPILRVFDDDELKTLPMGTKLIKISHIIR
ncbi:MAG: polysaccharide biosynthesis protein [Clostridia bacterium]|nr:polysaccharide biosynthesis protein [Clostridia bacterium]